MFSDNEKMFGERVMNPNAGDQEQTRLALSKVGIIKDFGANTTILVSITDGYNSNNRSRVLS